MRYQVDIRGIDGTSQDPHICHNLTEVVVAAFDLHVRTGLNIHFPDDDMPDSRYSKVIMIEELINEDDS